MATVRKPVALDPEKLERIREASNRDVVKSARRIKGDPARFDPNFRGPSARRVRATEHISHSQVFSVRKNAYLMSSRWDLPFKPAPKPVISFRVTKDGTVYRIP